MAIEQRQLTELPLKKIRIDGDTQARVKISDDIISLYAEEPEKLPPGKVVRDAKGQHWLYEGFHRYHALAKAGAPTMAVEVIDGTVEDARWLAAGSNKDHAIAGLRRSNADKERAVTMALQLRPKLSDGAIAEHTGTSQPFVSKTRQKLSATHNGYESTERTGRDGRTISTANIGTNPPATNGQAKPADKLIPELRARTWSPRFLPLLEALDHAQQHTFLARVHEGMSPQQALAEAQAQAMKPRREEDRVEPTNGRQPGDDTEAIAEDKRERKTAAEPGQTTFALREIREPLGILARCLAKLYHKHGRVTARGGVKEDADYHGVRRQMDDLESAFERLDKQFTRQAKTAAKEAG